MEVVLNKLGNQPELKSVSGLFDAIQKAKTILQTSLAQCQIFERRQKCLECFGIALAANRPKFAAIAFEGIQLILRDPAFGVEKGTPEGESRAEQLLALLMGIPNWREAATTQCQALALLVQLISSTEIPLKLKEALTAIEICKQTFDTAAEESTSVRPAARAALTQMLNSYVQNRLALAETGDSVEIGALMDVTALLGDLVARMGTGIEEAVDQGGIGNESKGSIIKKKTVAQQPLLLPLDALFSVLSALEPNQLERHQPLFNSLKSELLPVIICHLHGSAKNSASGHQQSIDSGNTTASKRIGSLLKRATSRQSADSAPPFSTISPAGIALDGAESARSFYQVVEQLLRLFTPMALSSFTLPPSSKFATNEVLFLLEELWRSALLGPPIAKRAEAIRLAKRIFNNLAAFAEILQLSAISGTDSFWLLLVECLEECAIGTEPKLAIDALRSLNALFAAILQLISVESFPKDVDLYAKLAHFEGERGIEESEKMDGENAKRRNSTAFPQQPEPVVKIFLDGFAEQLQKWQKCETALELDGQMQEWSMAILPILNGFLHPSDRKKGGEKRKSTASTPEDSGEEEDEEMEQKLEEGLSQIEAYSLVGMAIWELERRQKNVDEWRGQEVDSGENGKETPFVGNNQNQTSQMEGSKEYRNLLQGILREISTNFDGIPQSNLNKILPFFAVDPIQSAADSNPNRQQLSRWLRRLLHNCWGSIVRMLAQFPVRKQGASEEGKLATIEAIGTFVPLAVQIGMCTELCWAFELIGEQICALEELREAAKRASGEDPKAARRFCGRADILAMQILVENALATMRIAPKVAKHVIRCIQFLWELERWHFKLAKSTIDAIYEPPSLHIPPAKSGQNSPIGQLIGSTLPNLGELSSNELARLMEEFLAIIESIFSDGPSIIPLDSFCTLLSAISGGRDSKVKIYLISLQMAGAASANEDNLNYSNGMAPTQTAAQLLQCLCKLLSAKEHSPLIVKLAIWSRLKEHFIQCASSPTIPAEINRRTVDGLQDVLNSLLLWEWGGPVPKECQERIGHVQGWNAQLFDIFPQILRPKANEGNLMCTLETCHQIGQIQMAFLEQSVEMIGSEWKPFFESIKLLGQRASDEKSPASNDFDTPPNALSLTNLAVEILQKFLAIQKPTLLIVAYSPFLEALVHLLELATDGEDNQPIFTFLDQSERVLLEFLFGSVIPISALPKNFVEEEEGKLSTKWKEYWQKRGQKNGGKRQEKEEAENEDYLELLAELKTEIDEDAVEWPQMREWLEGGGKCEEGDGGGEQIEIGVDGILPLPWAHLRVPTDRCVAEIALHLMANLMEVTLKAGKAKATKLAVNLAEMLGQISAEIGPDFGIFCACSTILAQFRRQIRSPLTNAAARSLKQLLGILCAHSAITELIERGKEEGKGPMEGWQIWLMDRLLDLAVKCVAKGGILSLAGCSLLRRLCANAAANSAGLSNRLIPKCANAIWMACRYSLFPIRMLIAQFFINSTDFSGDLGQMKVSYRLGLDPSEAEERIENVHQLANQVFRLDGQIARHRGDNNNGTKARELDEDEAKGGSNDENAAHFPAKFAYLFLFEGSAGKKLSMGLDELMDSLLCQQLLVQLAAEQLLLLANGRGNDGGGEATSNAHGPLLGTLCATLAICEQFELRPGLKSLLQKLTGLPSAANIWTLQLTASNALIKFWIRQRHLNQILSLLAKIGGGAQFMGKMPSNLEQKDDEKKKAFKKSSSIRSNPFISQQMSQESQSTKNAEAAKVRILALGKLISMVETDFVDNQDSKELRQILADGIRKMNGGWENEELESSEKAKEMLEELAKKLEKN